MCIYPDCKIRPTYNFEGEKKSLYCAKHRKDGMVSMTHKSCYEEGCKTRPSYNFKGERKGLYCNKHKKHGMVDVLNKSCYEEGCNTIPHYNVEGETKGLYCAKHKKDGMINVIDTKCCEEGCKTLSTYNFEGEKKGLYCAKHKKDGMVHVKLITCCEEGCKTKPSYNFEGEKKGLYCAKHRKDGMVDVLNKACCEEGCKTISNYNFEGERKGLYCNKHKKHGMVNVVSKTCNSEWCSTIPFKNKYKGYCVLCFINLFPDTPVVRNYKTKECAVVDFVKNKFSHVDWISDKIVDGGCSRRRPDLLLDLGYQILIIEVDENQHNTYDCSCENKRIMELSQDMGHRPIIFIRFNPDEYDKNGKNITSCWSLNKNGICAVKKSKKNEWNQRLTCLEEHINYWIDPENKTNKTIETIHLFYDVSFNDIN